MASTGREKKFPPYAVFRLGRRPVVVVRLPTRGYGYGAVLYAYLVALYYARDRGLPIFFLQRKRELGASLTRMTAAEVTVVEPTLPRRVLYWLLWSARVGWAELRTPGRWRRWRNELVAGSAASTQRLIDLLAWVQERLASGLTAVRNRQLALYERLSEARPVLLPRIRPASKKDEETTAKVDLARPAVGARPGAREDARCRSLAESLGIDPDRPMVALHVRESGWRDSYYNHERPGDAVRNANPDTYRRATRWLFENGYQVVRLGDPTMRPMKARGVFDLAALRHGDSMFELWVVANSEFMIGSDSGPSIHANLSGTPLLTVNSVHLSVYMALPRDRFICKIARSPETGEPLTLAAMVAGGYISCKSGPTIGKMEEPYVDNTDGEILAAVREMVELARNGWDAPATPAQEAYRELLRKHRVRGYMTGEGQICDGFARQWLGVEIPAPRPAVEAVAPGS